MFKVTSDRRPPRVIGGLAVWRSSLVGLRVFSEKPFDTVMIPLIRQREKQEKGKKNSGLSLMDRVVQSVASQKVLSSIPNSHSRTYRNP